MEIQTLLGGSHPPKKVENTKGKIEALEKEKKMRIKKEKEAVKKEKKACKKLRQKMVKAERFLFIVSVVDKNEKDMNEKNFVDYNLLKHDQFIRDAINYVVENIGTIAKNDQQTFKTVPIVRTVLTCEEKIKTISVNQMAAYHMIM